MSLSRTNVDKLIHSFKTDLIKKFKDPKLVEYIKAYEIDYNSSSLTKRVKNTIPLEKRCEARKSNNERCTRRKKDESKYCGTHIKGQPHGRISDSASVLRKVQYHQIENKGIIYFIDNENNIYNHEDIYSAVMNPRKIAKYCDGIINFI